MNINMPKSVSYIIGQLEKNGQEAFAVGGCVRDVMLGRTPEDWDITTSAKPEQIKAVFPKTIDTGIQHGTVTVMINHVGYEVTTYRIDGEYEDGRHPKEVSFTTNLKRDLERRDFTINAMAYNEKSGLVDEFEGISDLQKKVIRCVGNAGQRFDEDALRMLRAVRFSGQLGFSIEPETKEAIVERAGNLEKISAERIRVEMTKLLISPGAAQILTAWETGMTKVFLPEFDCMMDCHQKNPHHIYTVGEHSVHAVTVLNQFMQHEMDDFKEVSLNSKNKIQEICDSLGKKQHIMLVLTMLLHDIAKPKVMQIDEQGIGHFWGHADESRGMAKKIMKRLTFDNDTIEVVSRLILWHDYHYEARAKSARKAASKIGKDIMWMYFLVQYADILSQNPDTFSEKLERLEISWKLYEEIEKKQQPLTLKDLAVNGSDLIKTGVKPGPELGVQLKKLLELVLDDPEKNTKEILLEQVKELGE